MGFLPTYFAAVMALAAAARASLTNVTTVYAGSDCSIYPGYSTGGTAWFNIQTNSCNNSSVEGFGDSEDIFYLEGVDEVTEGYITIVSNNELAKTPIQCYGAGLLEALVPSGVSGTSWTQINITNIPYSAMLMWGLPESATIPIEPYYHYVDGVQQDGLFLGSHNVMAWGITYEEVDFGSYGDPYWSIRLLGPGSEDPVTGQALGDGEYETFIRVTTTDE